MNRHYRFPAGIWKQARQLAVLAAAIVTLTGFSGAQSWQAFPSPTAPPVLAFASSPHTGALLAAVSGSGIYKSADNGWTWFAAANSGLTSFEVDSLLYIGSTLYAGTHNGVFVSQDDGNTWTASSSGLVFSYGAYATIFQLAQAPDGTVYAASDSGVYKSANLGASWTPTSTVVINGTTIRALTIDTHGTIYVGTTSLSNGGAPSLQGSVYRSTDGGVTWIGSGIQEWSIRGIAIDVQGNIYAGAWQTPYTQGGIYRSSDGGATWTNILPGVSVNVLAAAAGAVWAGTRDAVLYRSTSPGSSFVAVPSPVEAAFAICAMKPRYVYVGTDGVYFTGRAAQTWKGSRSGLALPTQVSQVVFPPDGSIYARSMLFGVWRSFDDGLTWASVNGGLSLESGRNPLYDEMFLNQYGEVLTSRQSTLYRLTGNNNNWVPSTLVASHYVTAHALLSSGELLVSDYQSCIYRSTDGGATFSGCLPQVVLGGSVTFRLYQGADNNLYAAEEVGGIWRSPDDGYTWTNLGPNFGGNTYDVLLMPNGQLLAAQASQPNGRIFLYQNGNWVRSDTGIVTSDVIYHLFLTAGGQVLAVGNLGMYTSFDGQNWTTINTGLPPLSRTYTEEIRPQFPVSDANGNVYVGFSYEGLGIFRSTGPL